MKSRFICRLPAAAGTLLLASQSCALAQAFGQPAATELDPIVVIGSRTPQPLASVLGDVSVIDRETLQRAGQNGLAEVLARAHAVEFVDNGGPQTVGSVFLRGANSNQTLVLIDGQRVNSATGGAAALNAVALNDIERVEILRGAASSLYGADAVGGVINIVTRQGADRPLTLSGSVGYGSHGASRLDVGLAGRARGWRYALNAGHGQSRGFDATVPGSFAHNPDRDSYYRHNASGTLGYTWRPGHEVSAQVYRSRINGGYDAGAPYFNDRSIQQLQGYSLASRDRITDDWHSTLRLGFTVDEVRSENAPAALNPDNPIDGISTFRTRQNQFSWQNDLQLNDNQRLTLAIERVQQQVAGDLADYRNFPLPPAYVDYPVTERNTNALTGVYTGDFGRHHVQASARRDHDSQYGGQTNGALAYGFDLTPRVRATVAGSTAFRAPTFNELYYPGGSNPDLLPEESRTLEAGLRYLGDATELGITVYRNRVTNLISGFPPVNIGKAVLEGVTLTAAHRFGSTGIRASADLQNPHDADTGEQLPLRARRILRLAADHRIGAALLGAEWYVSSERYGNAREPLAGYGRLDLTASYDLTSETQVQVRWNNVFDKDYTLMPGYATPGASVFVTLAYRPQ